MFFYLFVCYHYSKHNYPERTEQFLICMGYNILYLFSKLQILFYKSKLIIHDFLIKYEEYQKMLLFIEKTLNDLNFNSSTSPTSSQSTPLITLDFILNNEISFSFEKDELINDYLCDFFPDDNDVEDEETDHDEEETNAEPKESILSAGRKAIEKILLPDDYPDPDDEVNEQYQQQSNEEPKESKESILTAGIKAVERFLHPDEDNEIFYDIKESKETKESKESTDDNIIDYDFIVINCEDGLKKIIKDIDSIKNDFVSEYSSIFQLEPFLYKPLLCEFLNGDDEKATKIDFCDNNKFYDFLVVGNCFDKTFLTYFMKKYYEIDVKDKYILKILDNNVNIILFDESDILRLDENCISKLDK
jgi:hypothetical protein